MKKLNKIGFFVATFSLLLVPSAFASYSYCGQLKVEVSNQTGRVCVLVRYIIRHGGLFNTTMSTTLYNRESRSFALEQTVFGPTLSLHYICGHGTTIVIHSAQNYCMFHAGKITGQVIEKHGLDAIQSKVEGSYFWNNPGTIRWTLIRG